MNPPKTTECCEKCRGYRWDSQRMVHDEEPVCKNPSCPCHKPASKERCPCGSKMCLDFPDCKEKHCELRCPHPFPHPSYTKRVIKKAEEAGWKNKSPMFHGYPDKGDICVDFPLSCYLLDPSFRQALGNTLGWEKDERNRYWECPRCDYTKPYFSHNDLQFCSTDGRKLKEIEGEPIPNRSGGWAYHMHNLTDHLIDGKDIESYFSDLLK